MFPPLLQYLRAFQVIILTGPGTKEGNITLFLKMDNSGIDRNEVTCLKTAFSRVITRMHIM